MKFQGTTLAVLAAHAAASSSSEADNPLAKVLSLLDELAAKINKEGEAEAKAYHDFVEWCDDASANKGFEIKTAKATKAKLEAAISRATADGEAATSRIEELAGSIAGSEADLKSATEIRQHELKDFQASEAELVDSIDTVGRAITLLEREMQKHPAAFAQVDTSNMNNVVKALDLVVDAAAFSTADKHRLAALVQSQEGVDADADDEGEGEEAGAPAAAAYKSRSGDIVDTLEGLKEKAEEQLASLRQAETNAAHNYNMLKQSIENQMKADNKDLTENKSAKASAAETKATAENDLSTTVKALEDGQVALETVKGDCMTTAADHESTVASREEELKVIAQAKAILSNSTSGAAEQSYAFLQIAYTTGSSMQTQADLAQAEVVTLLRRLAKQQHSATLAQLASRVAAVVRFSGKGAEDPFVKVRQLIQDLLSKLQAEAGSDATEKAYCDEQMAKTEEKKGDLEYTVSKLTTKIDKAVSASAGLKADVKRFQDELSALMKSQAEMDKVRQESHEAYSEAKSDLEQGLEGVRKALVVLRDYYGNGAGAASASMIQDLADDDQPAPPEKHEKSAGAGGSIISILEVVESDFAKNLATEETEEADAQAEYEKTSQQNEITKTMKEQDVKYSTKEYKQLDKDIADLTSDRETSSTELNAVLEYYEKIKARCIAKPETYEERKQRRTAEIEGLKEALSILEDETAFTQQRKKGHRGAVFLSLRR